MKSREFSRIRYESLDLTDESANVLGDETTLYEFNFLMLWHGKKQYVLISSQNLENIRIQAYLHLSNPRELCFSSLKNCLPSIDHFHLLKNLFTNFIVKNNVLCDFFYVF